VRPLRREISRRLTQAAPVQVIELARRIIMEEPDLRWFAYELAHHHRTTLRSLDQESLETLGRGMESWQSVDPFAVYLAGPAWREGQVSSGLILKWADSPDRWWRRAALASTAALNNRARGGSRDPEDG
jgi:hypothetical protein